MNFNTRHTMGDYAEAVYASTFPDETKMGWEYTHSGSHYNIDFSGVQNGWVECKHSLDCYPYSFTQDLAEYEYQSQFDHKYWFRNHLYNMTDLDISGPHQGTANGSGKDYMKFRVN